MCVTQRMKGEQEKVENYYWNALKRRSEGLCLDLKHMLSGLQDLSPFLPTCVSCAASAFKYSLDDLLNLTLILSLSHPTENSP